jgi:hypothetical protein
MINYSSKWIKRFDFDQNKNQEIQISEALHF